MPVSSLREVRPPCTNYKADTDLMEIVESGPEKVATARETQDVLLFQGWLLREFHQLL